VVLLQNRDLERYRQLLDEMDERLEKESLSVEEEVIAVSLARGVSFYDPQIDRVYDDVFVKADHAMYLHKQSQKNSVV
jgi:GGDEF domain-containing protein